MWCGKKKFIQIVISFNYLTYFIEYFKNFLRLAPIGKITYIICEELSGGAIAIANGLYDFELHEDGQVSSVPARFTFVLENVDLKWKILSHHSSRISASPESS